MKIINKERFYEFLDVYTHVTGVDDKDKIIDDEIKLTMLKEAQEALNEGWGGWNIGKDYYWFMDDNIIRGESTGGKCKMEPKIRELEAEVAILQSLLAHYAQQPQPKEGFDFDESAVWKTLSYLNKITKWKWATDLKEVYIKKNTNKEVSLGEIKHILSSYFKYYDGFPRERLFYTVYHLINELELEKTK